MTQSLAGRRVLVVEDDFFHAADLEADLLRSGAAVVGPAAKVCDALERVKAGKPDLAVLDINLGGEWVYPVADALAAAGVPFLFASGYSRQELPDRFQDRILVEKPFPAKVCIEALAKLAQDPVAPDLAGDLHDIDAVRELAANKAFLLLAEGYRKGEDRRGWTIRARNEAGTVVLTISLAEAVDQSSFSDTVSTKRPVSS